MSSIAAILAKYNTPDHWLGTRNTAIFESEMVREMCSFSDFKEVYSFIHSNDLDDSATGLEYLYGRMNEIIRVQATEEDWPWIKAQCFRYDDQLFESVIDVYRDNHRDEIIRILIGGTEFYWHDANYYKAECLMGTPEYEPYLDEQLKKGKPSDDILALKADLLIARGEKDAAFNLIKDEKRLVLKSADLLDGEEKEQYLLTKIKQYPTREWWDKLCSIAGDKYISELIDSPKHCEMVNWQLYNLKRYEELIERINTGWIYDDPWGQLNDNIEAKYAAIKIYKKLEKVYPKWYCSILVDYSVYMIEKNGTRKSYHYSAGTMKRVDKICPEAKLGSKAAKELVEKHPKRTAMIEEFRIAELLE